MSSPSDPDRDTRPPVVSTEPDAHGQAALLLAESMLHALVETQILKREAAIVVIETAMEVKVQVAEIANESMARMIESLRLLSAIAESLRTDQPD